jgi:branched-chain amino acid transport system substrate-binding protein
VTKARLHATKLAQDKDCLAIIGPSLTHTSMTVLEITQKTKLPLISCAAGSAITTPAKDRFWTFKTAQTDQMAVERIYQYCKKNLSRWPSSPYPAWVAGKATAGPGPHTA